MDYLILNITPGLSKRLPFRCCGATVVHPSTNRLALYKYISNELLSVYRHHLTSAPSWAEASSNG